MVHAGSGAVRRMSVVLQANRTRTVTGRLTREAFALVALVILLAVVFVASLVLGSTWIPVSRVIDVLFAGTVDRDAAAIVVETVRLPRSFTAMLSGAALGIAGLQMQTLFRNPLADPFVLGVSSGASLGVALSSLAPATGRLPRSAPHWACGATRLLSLAAILGAMAVLGLVLAVSVRIANPTTVLILGLMFGYAVSAIVIVLVGASSPERLQQWAMWGFGSFSGVTWQRLRLFAPLTLGGVLIACATTKQLNALLLGEHYARSMGLAVRRARLITMLGASVLGARGHGLLRSDHVPRHRGTASVPRTARHLGPSRARAGRAADGCLGRPDRPDRVAPAGKRRHRAAERGDVAPRCSGCGHRAAAQSPGRPGPDDAARSAPARCSGGRASYARPRRRLPERAARAGRYSSG